MKSKEELNELKEEVEKLDEKLHELTEEELAQVVGGAPHPSDVVHQSAVHQSAAVPQKAALLSAALLGTGEAFLTTDDLLKINTK